jgi:hypothetical protein
MITPIIDADHPIQRFFIKPEYGLLVTSAASYSAMSYLCTVVGIILVRDRYQARKPPISEEVEEE